VGDPIPPAREIARLNTLSLATVRKALQNLVQNGFLHRTRGKGTFVSDTARRRKKVRYYAMVKRFENNIGRPTIKFLELKRIPGDRQINRHLNIRSNQDLYELRRIVCFNRKPLIYCISYLPNKLCPGLESIKKIYFEKYALCIFLEHRFGITTMRNRDLYSAVLADREQAEILGIKKGHPLLCAEMQALTHKEKPYEYRISYCLTDERKIRRIY
jgi:DNA-binding GntR family transcriptional regulator